MDKKNLLEEYMMTTAKHSLALVLMIIFAVVTTSAQAAQITGYVYTRAPILSENSKPIWCEYADDGSFVFDIAEATGQFDPNSCRVISGLEYQGYVDAYNALQGQYNNQCLLMSRDEYFSTDLYTATGVLINNKPDTESAYVVLLPENMRLQSDQLILAKYPVNPMVDIVDAIQSLLIDSSGLILHETSNRIGFKAAFLSDEEGRVYDPDQHRIRKSTDQIHGPISGVSVEKAGFNKSYTDDEGHYVLRWYSIPCPYHGYNIEGYAVAKLYSRRFNPKAATSTRSYYLWQRFNETCVPEVDCSYTHTFGFVTGHMCSPMSMGKVTMYPTNVDFLVDTTVLAGRAYLSQGDGVIPIGDTTVYSLSGFTPTRGGYGVYDYDGDGILDTVVIGSMQDDTANPGKKRFTPGQEDVAPADLVQGIYLSMSGKDPATDQPDFTKLMDWTPNFGHEGLVTAISEQDLRNTDLYVFRVADGELISEQIGLSESTNDIGADEDRSRFYYSMMMRGSRSVHDDRVGPIVRGDYSNWQADSGVNPELHEKKADHLKPGDQIRIVAVNRTTGYIGSVFTEMQAVGSSGTGDMSFKIDEIVMTPPNLKVWVERNYEIIAGLSKGEVRQEQIIGYEGAGLTSDTFIAVYTEWLDQNDAPLPSELAGAGFTGRIVQLSDNKVLPGNEGGIHHFEINPGRHMQVLQIPQEQLSSQHFYLQVSGEPISGTPVFYNNTRIGAPDFTSTGANPGKLSSRPDRYVPFMVPVFDEETTEIQRQAYNEALDNNPYVVKPKPVYEWCYRPEMQYSMYDLEIDAINRQIDENTSEDILANDSIISCDDNWADIFYSLTTTDLLPLDYIDLAEDKELVFSVGGQEIQVTIGSDQTIRFDNLEHLELLDANDFLTIRLATNNDAGNTLWEYSLQSYAIDHIDIETAEQNLPVPPGLQVRAVATTIPENRPVVWSLLEYQPSDEAYPIIASIDSATGMIRVEDGSGFGDIKIRATDAQYDTIYKDALVCVGCLACSASNQEYCDKIAAAGYLRLASIDVRFSLGQAEKGRSAGDLYIRSKVPNADMSTPKGLVFNSLVRGVKPVYDEKGLRQVLAPKTFVDIHVIDSFNYEIRFYDPSARNGKQGNLYTLDPSALPNTIWRIQNPDSVATIYNRLVLTEIKDGSSSINEYVWNATEHTWSLSKNSGALVETRTEEQIGDNLVCNRILRDSNGVIGSHTRTTFHEYPWGKSVIETVTNPAGEALTTTTSYYDDSGASGSYGKVRLQVNPDESWQSYKYDAQGRTTMVVRSWLDAPAGSSAGSARATAYSYAPAGSQDAKMPEDAARPRMVTETIQGIVTGKTYYSYSTLPNGDRVEITERCASASSSFGDAANTRTAVITNAPGTDDPGSGYTRSIEYDDGRLDTYAYEKGTYTAGSPGVFMPGDGTYRRTTITHGTKEKPQGIANRTTREVSIEDKWGRTLITQTLVCTGSSYECIQWTSNEYDSQGRLLASTNSDGTCTQSTWDCCNRTSSIDSQGISHTYEYDVLKRMVTETRQGTAGGAYPAQPDMITTHTYDPAGRRLSSTITAGSIIQTRFTDYDGAGRIESQTDAANRTTTYSYAQGGRITTVTRPGSIIETTERHLDGRTHSITGTGVIPRYYTYGVNPDGTQWTTVHTGSAGSPVWEKTTSDLLGRTISTERPGPVGIETVENIYDEKGRLVKTITPGQADTLYVYDELGNQYMTGLDIDASGTLDPGGTDRINSSETEYAKIEGSWWQESVQMVYEDSAPVTAGTSRSRLTGLGGGITAQSVSIDINGNETISQTSVNRTSKMVTQTTHHPDSAIDSRSISVNGLLMASRTQTGIEYTYEYDAMGRRTGLIDPRIGKSTTHYNENGEVDYVEDAESNRTTYTYDAETGRRLTETNALSKVTRYAYNLQGQVTHTWGDATYPVSYDYDDYGRMTQMKTYRTEDGWSGETFPASAAGDTTRWNYDEATGLLLSKEDASGNSTSYTYTTGGKLNTRIWSRLGTNNALLVTTYAYDNGTGELLTIDYSDDTPDIGFTYDRLGRQVTITDGAGSRTFTYNDKLQPEAETITGMINAEITRTYETAGVPGRADGLSLDTEYSLTYGYDDYGRFSNIGWSAGTGTGTATYAYVPGSELIRSLTTDSAYQAAYTYEPHRNLRTQVRNTAGGTLISQYDYEYDKLGRRTSALNTGSAFSAPAFNLYTYNDRSELTSSTRYQGTDITDTSNPVTPQERSYAYDPIGNRTEASGWDETASTLEHLTYTANQLNQYDLIDIDTGPSQGLTYDTDGNMTSITTDGVTVEYTYNAENRLIAVAPQSPSDGDKRLEYAYDYMGRRVNKKVYSYSAGSWLQEYESLYIYDGWNLIKETMQGQSVVDSYYVWGLDLSQTQQGAGGVGGLVARVEGSLTSNYLYDANGNVGQLVDASNGTILAHYEYDPYGNLVDASGSAWEENAFRFSTKYFDGETGLYYYGYRYYLAQIGRWVSRDPIEEIGGINLFSSFNNSPINQYDMLGLAVPAVIIGIAIDVVKTLSLDFLKLSDDKFNVCKELAERLRLDMKVAEMDYCSGTNIDLYNKPIYNPEDFKKKFTKILFKAILSKGISKGFNKILGKQENKGLSYALDKGVGGGVERVIENITKDIEVDISMIVEAKCIGCKSSDMKLGLYLFYAINVKTDGGPSFTVAYKRANDVPFSCTGTFYEGLSHGRIKSVCCFCRKK